jgi:DNA primase
VALDYLQNTRKLSLRLIQDYQLSWSPELPFGVVLPIFMQGVVQALQVRFLTKSFAKYVFYPAHEGEDLKKKTLLYNYDKVKNGVDTLYVVEGIFDVLCSEHQKTVCTFGKQVSIEQANLIRQIPKDRLVLAYDTDVKLGELQRSVERLEAFSPVFIKRLPKDHDPADLGADFMKQPEFEFLEFITNQ